MIKKNKIIIIKFLHKHNKKYQYLWIKANIKKYNLQKKS